VRRERAQRRGRRTAAPQRRIDLDGGHDLGRLAGGSAAPARSTELPTPSADDARAGLHMHDIACARVRAQGDTRAVEARSKARRYGARTLGRRRRSRAGGCAAPAFDRGFEAAAEACNRHDLRGGHLLGEVRVWGSGECDVSAEFM